MIRALALLFAFAICVPAFAGIYIEPYVGYVEGTVKIKETVTISGQSFDFTGQGNEHGVAYGGKLGLSMLGFTIGGDYMTGSPESDDSTSTITDIGAFVSYSFPILLRVSATYFFSSKVTDVLETDINNVEHLHDAKGTGYKITIGYSLLPYLSLNLDYFAHSWTDIPLDTGVTALKGTDSGGMLGLSIPISL